MHQTRNCGPWRVWENFRGCGTASGVVSSSDEGVWALQLVITISEWVMSDSENIFEGLKRVSADQSRTSEGISKDADKKGKEKRLL